MSCGAALVMVTAWRHEKGGVLSTAAMRRAGLKLLDINRGIYETLIHV